VVAMAKRAGFNNGIRATPSVALGSYETTPLELAGAYTLFANDGVYVAPNFISKVEYDDGTVVHTHQPQTKRALNPQVNYLMVSLMKGVILKGTGAGARRDGLRVPAAGKTGSSRDGWFAGFTKDLLCVVWVGFDDNRDISSEAAKTALPIWTSFMKRAVALKGVPADFKEPGGLVNVTIDPTTGRLPGPYCPTGTEVFIQGTQPRSFCTRHDSPYDLAEDTDRQSKPTLIGTALN
jgi:penicillin-binding protein 1B